MDFEPEKIRMIVQGMITLLLSIAVHEFGHAFVADRLGDRLPRSQGRVTLNPLVHADPVGTLAFPLISMVIASGVGFGWGRPVEVSPASFTRRLHMRTGHMLVAAAGPAMNLLFGVLIAVVHWALLHAGVLEPGHDLNAALVSAVQLNFVLLFFNLVPAPPLDGGTVLAGLLPTRYLPAYERFAVYGPFVLMAVIFIPQLKVLFLGPAVWLFRVTYGLLGFPL